jgi:hypothetical protein
MNPYLGIRMTPISERGKAIVFHWSLILGSSIFGVEVSDDCDREEDDEEDSHGVEVACC